MAEKINGKRVPWSHLEDYLKVHESTIVAFQSLLKLKVMDIPEIEAKLPNSF